MRLNIFPLAICFAVAFVEALPAQTVAVDDQATQAPPAVEKAPANKRTNPWQFTADPKLPNVLILGDSISIGYTVEVRKLLAGKANVYRPMNKQNTRPENCSGTTKGVTELKRWLSKSEWDVIHFNFGLHDLKHVTTAGGNEKSNDPGDPTQASLEQYTENMKEIVAQLKATGAKLVFATTTPVVPGTLNPLRTPEAPMRYNQTAVKMMQENNIRVNDLHAFCLPNLDEWQKPKNVHFVTAGSKALAGRVAQVIEDELAN